MPVMSKRRQRIANEKWGNEIEEDISVEFNLN